MRNILTDEEIKTLTKVKPKPLNLNISKKDYLRSLCTHSDNYGKDILIRKEDGSVYCPICGAEFNAIDNVERKDIEDDINKVINYIQTIKFIGNFPREIAEAIYPIIPLLKKIPELYELTVNNFNTAPYEPTPLDNNPYLDYNPYDIPNIMGTTPYVNLYNAYNAPGIMKYSPYNPNERCYQESKEYLNNTTKHPTSIKDLIFDSEDDDDYK